MSLPTPTVRMVDMNMPGQLISTAPINSYTALSIPAYFRAMVFLASNMASFPRSVQSLDEVNVPHALDELLSLQPNGLQDAYTFWQTLFFHAAHYANGYAEVIRGGGTLRPYELRNLLPDSVIPFRFDRGDGKGVRQYYYVRGRDVLTADNVIHLPRLSYDGMAGMNTISLHERTLQRASLIEAYVTRFLERGSIIRGSIEIPMEMDDDQVEQIVEKLRKYFSGADSERDIIVLSGGSKLNNAGINPKDSELVQQGTLSVKQVSMITGVPPQFLFENSESKYVNTVEQAGQDVVRYTFRPWIVQTENQLTLKLLSRQERAAGLRININPDALLRGDTKTQADIGLAEVDKGVQSPNEYRRAKGMPASKDAEADKLKRSGDTTGKAPPAKPGEENPPTV